MAERYKNQPKKIVGFQPTTDDAMFPMDEDLPPASASTVQTLSKRPSQEMTTPTNISFSSYAATSPQYVGRNIRRPSNTSLGSPSQLSSFQDRLFPRLSQTSMEESITPTIQEKPEPKEKKEKLNPKQMSKKERRELQEQQRAEKASKAPQAQKVKPKVKPSSSPPKVEQSYRPPTNKKQLKKKDIVQGEITKTVGLFSHLPQYDPEYNLVREKNASGIVHPCIISLGVQYAESAIVGGNARCMALMLGLSRVISDYVTPSGTSLHRNLTQHISKQVDYISNMRPMAPSMKTAIRFIKNEIANLDSSLPDEDKLCDLVQEFIDLRINDAHAVIVNSTLETRKIKDGDVIVTFARSSIVLKLLLQAHEKGIEFRVVVVDSRPKLEGKDTAQILSRHGIKCSYVYTNSLFLVMKEATKVIVGASSILSNGDLMSRVGTSIVAMSAYDNKVPVMVLCEIYKFSDTVRLDSFVWNEIGNPDALVDVSNIPPSKRLLPSLRTDEKNTNGVLENWRQIDTLKLLNLTYDITPAKFITMVCCEFGQIPSTLVLSVLRSQNLFQA